MVGAVSRFWQKNQQGKTHRKFFRGRGLGYGEDFLKKSVVETKKGSCHTGRNLFWFQQRKNDQQPQDPELQDPELQPPPPPTGLVEVMEKPER